MVTTWMTVVAPDRSRLYRSRGRGGVSETRSGATAGRGVRVERASHRVVVVVVVVVVVEPRSSPRGRGARVGEGFIRL